MTLLSESHLVPSDSLRPHGLYGPWNSPGQNTGVGSLSLLQGISQTQGLNPGLSHYRRILYQLSYKGSLTLLQPLINSNFLLEYSFFTTLCYLLLRNRRRQWHPTPVLLPEKSHGRRSLVGYSPWGRKESDTTERLDFTFHFHALEKEIATHSSVLAWRIPGTGEPGGLLSMGLHRVGHDWSDLAAAASV